MYIKYGNVYVLAITNKNAHAAMCLNFITEVSKHTALDPICGR